MKYDKVLLGMGMGAALGMGAGLLLHRRKRSSMLGRTLKAAGQAADELAGFMGW